MASYAKKLFSMGIRGVKPELSRLRQVKSAKSKRWRSKKPPKLLYLRKLPGWFICLLILCVCCLATSDENEDDLYKLLGVSRDASVKDIRRAFKKLAVKLHPDKNKDDQNADERFVKLAQAYDILKDPETRKHYDLHGDTGMPKGGKQPYQSYTYYRDEFGIYDDDPLIVTLSKADYEINILDHSQPWFVNFYSPHCHHCHELAPAWRKLAQELEGVLRIAAVNCEEDWTLCRQLSVQSYPTLLYYEKEAHLYEGELYKGQRTLGALQEFVLSRIIAKINEVTPQAWNAKGLKKEKMLLFLCPEHSAVCPQYETQIKLAAIMEGLMPVGRVKDPNLCKEISSTYEQSPIVFWQVNEGATQVREITGSDTKEIVDKILDCLPNPDQIDDEAFRKIRIKLRSGEDKARLICFYLGAATELHLQLKRLMMMISNVNLGLVNCGKHSVLCGSLHVSHYPAWGVLKHGGAFEMYHGRDVLYEIASFARDSVKSTNFHALSPADFYNIQKDGSAWFVDWFAPWCPPCRKLMPEVRRASQHFSSDTVQFGAIDCTQHNQLCTREGIRSYPTTMIYNSSKVHYFHGTPNEQTIVEFVQDTINPVVISLDISTFAQLENKPVNELWIVDFFASWCGPCQRLAPDWRALAKQLVSFKQIKVAQVDCVANQELCNSQNIRSYPTIRLYPLESKGLNMIAMYNGHRDVFSMKRWVIAFLPSPVEALTPDEFTKQILTKRYVLPWLVDFYAPWCGHCINFEPEFITVAQKLQGKVRTAKIDCELYREFCAQQRVISFPTVILYVAPGEKFDINSQVSNEIIQQVKSIISRKKSVSHDEL